MAPVIKGASLPPERRSLVVPRSIAAEPARSPVESVTIPAATSESRLIEELKAQNAALAREIARLKEEATTARDQAARDGYAHGVAKGTAEGLAAFQARLKRADALIETLQARFIEEISSLEDMGVGIAHAAVCRLLGERLATPDGVRAVVGQVIAEVKGQERLVVRLSPPDYELAVQGGLVSQLASRQEKVEVVADERVGLGGCTIDTSYGSLDGRLETQLRQLSEALLSTRARRDLER